MNRSYNKSQTDYEALMTARNRMMSYWNTYRLQKQQKQSTTILRNTLANCTAQADIMIEKALMVVTNCSEAIKSIDSHMESYDIAQSELQYVLAHASVSPSGYSTANSKVNQMRSTINSMSSKRPTLQTRYDNVLKYGQEANDMKSKATSENRNIGSKAFRR